MKVFTRVTRLVNVKGELFASTFTYGVTAAIKLGSSLVLTRLLSPEAYGIFGILFSFLSMVELLSDVGTVALLIRHPRGNEKTVVHTIWTLRLIRCAFNFCLLFLCAPIISSLYHTPALTNAFRTLSFWFLLYGAESMAFILAQRDQRARISNYAEMISNAVMTIFVIGVASVLRNHYALIYGALLQRGLLAVASHFFYREVGVGIAFDRETMADQFRLARFVLPSSLMTMALSQYDKLVLLRLSNLTVLGIYGIAGNMLGPVSGVIAHNARVVLYARASQYFRTNRATAVARYYAENKRLLLVGVLLPATVAGFAHPLVAILYDARYAAVGTTLMIFALGAIVSALQNASENVLVASGPNHFVLVSNVVRLFSLIPATLLGYFFFGYYGFLWFGFASTFVPLAYYYYEQQKVGLLRMKQELRLFAIALAWFALCFVVGQILLALTPAGWLHLGLRKH